MKKCRSLTLFFFLILVLSLLVSCDGNGSGSVYTVTFLSEDGDVLSSQTYGDGAYVSPPDAEEKPSEIFIGWYREESDTAYDFSAPVRSDMTLTARYRIDYESLTNRITGEMMTANFTVETRHYRTPYSYDTSIASGVVIERSGDTCFLLTNCHNTKKSGYLYAEYFVTDCYGNRFTATLNSFDDSYDLAVLFFTAEKEYSVVKLAESNTKPDTVVAAVGQPGGQRNALTYGRTKAYRSLGESDGEESAVMFDVLLHTAPTDHGSSGGALLDPELRLVGLNFAVLRDREGEFLYTAAIPAEKIAEYLESHPFY